jgi:hypothetical protein
MKLFKRDTAEERRKTLDAAATAAATLAQLRAERQATLLDADLEVIERHDATVAAQERRIATLQEKLRLLTDEQRRERQEQREADREAAIKVIEKKLAGREALASKLEAAIEDMEKYYFQLTGFQSPLLSDWPFPAPRPGFGRINLAGINREVSFALYSSSRPIEGRPRMPSGSSLDLGVAGIKPEGITGLVARENREIIETLYITPLGRDDDIEAA